MTDTIIAKNLSFYFADKQILDQIDFHVQEGEIFGLYDRMIICPFMQTFVMYHIAP